MFLANKAVKKKIEAFLNDSLQFTTCLFQLKLRASKSTTNVKDVHVKPHFHLSRYRYRQLSYQIVISRQNTGGVGVSS